MSVIDHITVDPQWKIGIIHSLFYEADMDRLVQSAEDALAAAGIPLKHISIHPAAGSFEVPLIGSALAKKGNIHGLIGLGIVVQGETDHARLIAESAARGIMRVQLETQVPFAFEILAVRSLKDARSRLQKGEEAAWSVLHSLAQLRLIRS